MAQMRRVEFPKIVLTLTEVDDDGIPALEPILRDGKPLLGANGQPLQRAIQKPVKAQQLHTRALIKAGGAAGYEGLRLHLSISAAIEEAKNSFVLLDEDQWKADVKALEGYTEWPWYHKDVLKVIDAAKDAEKVNVEVKEEKPNRTARRRQART